MQLGIALEPAAELAAKEGSRLGDRLDYARRVGQDLHRFLASFATATTPSGDALVMPANALDRHVCIRCSLVRACTDARARPPASAQWAQA